jgi:hypothetical protein
MLNRVDRRDRMTRWLLYTLKANPGSAARNISSVGVLRFRYSEPVAGGIGGIGGA